MTVVTLLLYKIVKKTVIYYIARYIFEEFSVQIVASSHGHTELEMTEWKSLLR